MRALHVLGRAIFGGFFVYNGINHLQNSSGMGQYAAAKGVPAAEQVVQASGLMLLAGGLSIMAGLKPKQGLATIIAFLVPVSLQMHRFWEESDPQKRQTEMIQFMKNMALVGAALTLMHSRDPWPASIDSVRNDNEEMFVRLGGRDLRALPA
jgi:putative oxidoreductase